MDDDLDDDLKATLEAIRQGSFLSNIAEICELEFRAGRKAALFETMYFCIGADAPLPVWAKVAFLEAYDSKPRSWDEAFGRPVPKGKSAAKARKLGAIELKLWFRVREMHKAGVPIDDGMFEKVGKEFKVSLADAKRIYYTGGRKAREEREAIVQIAEAMREDLGPVRTANAMTKWLDGDRAKELAERYGLDLSTSQKPAKD
jgi:hypothetical protein